MPELALFYPVGHAAHAEPGHPERPERVEAVRQGLAQAGWWDQARFMAPEPLPEDRYQRVHTPAYLAFLQAASAQGRPLDGDTYTTPASWDLARQAAEGAAAVAAGVWLAEGAAHGFALCRPPGHHATRSRGMGFCLLNNVALAAEHLIAEYGARRLAIVDIDLHHGNGTQDIFWERSDVFYLSLHQAAFYPGTGRIEERGAGDGLGTTANFPLPAGSGDQAFLACFEQVVAPLLTAYRPEMLLVSYGFDPHWRDPLGALQMTADGFGRLVAALQALSDRLCQGRMALFLEGGYDLAAAAVCSNAAVAAMLGAAWEDPLGPPPQPEGRAWQAVLAHARRIWEIDG